MHDPILAVEFFFREINYHFPLGRSLGAWLPGWFHGYAGGMYCIIVYFLTNLKKSRQKTREMEQVCLTGPWVPGPDLMLGWK